MKPRLAVPLRALIGALIIALVVLALFLVFTAVFWSNVNSAPTATTGVELLITVILCLSLSLWAAFVDKEAKLWERVLVLVGLILGSLLFFLSYLAALSNLQWMTTSQQTPAIINNGSIVVDCLVAITIILLLSTIAVFGLILRRSRSRALLVVEGCTKGMRRQPSDHVHLVVALARA